MSDVLSGVVSGGIAYRGWSDCKMASTIELDGCHSPGTKKWRLGFPHVHRSSACSRQELQEAPKQRYTRTLKVLSAQVLLCIVRHVKVTCVNVAGEE